MSNDIEKVQVSDITCDQLMDEAAEELARIDERAEIAIQVVTQSIRTQAAVAKGRVILEVREKYGHRPDFEGSFTAFAERIGTTQTTVLRWVKAAQAVEEHSPAFSDQYMMSLSPTVLHELTTLPDSVQSAILEDAVEDERKITRSELVEVRNSTPVKIMAATEALEEKNELLNVANELISEAKETGIKSDSPEYKALYQQATNAKEAIESLNEKIVTLKADLETEQKEAEASKKAQQEIQEELDKMKFDDEISVGLMVKRTGYNLQNMVPQVLSDVQRFNATKGRFPEELRLHLETMIEQLTTYLNEHYA